jgi:broad specificity phosphatase PhoE
MITEYPQFDMWLIRHGQSTTNANPDLMGQLGNVPLSELGVKQAKALSENLKDINFDYVYSSDYTRAQDTALIACPGRIIWTDSLLREYCAGDWTGVNRHEAVTQDVKLEMNYLGGSFKPPGPLGESLNMVQRRATQWLDEYLIYNKEKIARSRNSKLNIAVFSHGMTIKTILQYIMGFDRNFMWKVNISNTGVCKLSFDKEGWRVNCINDTSHLLNLK